MILTCHDCPRQLAFPGKSVAVRHAVATAFASAARDGEGYLCVPCAATARQPMICEGAPS